MNNVKVNFFSTMANLTNNEKEVFIKASSVREALEKIVVKYGDNFKNRIFESENKLKRIINIYVNGKNICFLEGLETIVGYGDEITLLPAVSGGSPNSPFISSNTLGR